MHPHKTGANDVIETDKAVIDARAATCLGGHGVGQQGGGDGDGGDGLVSFHNDGPPQAYFLLAVTFQAVRTGEHPAHLQDNTMLWEVLARLNLYIAINERRNHQLILA
jgi:hypothetical protein